MIKSKTTAIYFQTAITITLNDNNSTILLVLQEDIKNEEQTAAESTYKICKHNIKNIPNINIFLQI